jgi:hypothetical protein
MSILTAGGFASSPLLHTTLEIIEDGKHLAKKG